MIGWFWHVICRHSNVQLSLCQGSLWKEPFLLAPRCLGRFASNYCLSFKSWDDCKNSTKQVSCLNSQDRCCKANLKAVETGAGATSVGFDKGCVTSTACWSRSICSSSSSVKITKCENDCCKGDPCNGAKVQMVPGIEKVRYSSLPNRLTHWKPKIKFGK